MAAQPSPIQTGNSQRSLPGFACGLIFTVASSSSVSECTYIGCMECITSRTKKLRIASYNIRKAKGVDGRYDPERIIDILAHLDADIIAVQEIDFRWNGRLGAISPEMIAQHTDYVLADVADNDRSLGWHGNAILTRRDLKVESTSRITLPGLEPRGAIRIDLSGGIDLSVVATHLGLTRFHRRKQLGAIRRAIDPTRGPTVILGDFNEWSSVKGLENITLHFSVHAPGKSFHSAMPLAALDRFALSHDIELVDAGVWQTAQSLKASDHLPIWGDILLRPLAA